jgi:hypothetical protein
MKVKNTHNNILPEWQLQSAVMHLIYILLKKTDTFFPLLCYDPWKKAEGKNVAVDEWI